MKRLYVVLAAAVATLLAVGSAVAGLGPDSKPDVGARALPTELTYGDRGRPEPPAGDAPEQRARRATPRGRLPRSVRAPGVLPTPARAPLPTTGARPKRGKGKRERRRPDSGPLAPAPTAPAPVAPVPTAAEDPCAKAPGPPRDAAPARVDGLPKPGTYRFRQTGSVRTGSGIGRADAQVNRVFGALDSPVAGVRRYDVRVTGGGLTSVSTFEVDQRGIDDGVFLASTRSSSLDSLNFVPALRVRLLPLPAVTGKTWTSVGTDPLTGSSMIVNGRVAGREDVNVCGRAMQGWRVELGTAGDRPSLSIGPDGAVRIEGSMVIATGAGGAVIREQLREVSLGSDQATERSATASEPIERTP